MLLLQYFKDTVQELVGGLKTIDIMDIVASMIDKVMVDMPSLVRKSDCQNKSCSLQQLEQTTPKILLIKWNEKFSIQSEVD